MSLRATGGSFDSAPTTASTMPFATKSALMSWASFALVSLSSLPVSDQNTILAQRLALLESRLSERE